jgi:cytochrome c553
MRTGTALPVLRASLCAAALLAGLPASAQPGDPASADADVRAALATRGDPARGLTAFEDCAPCHRKDASGRVNGSIPRLTGQHATVIVKQTVDIRSGRRLNAAMKAVIDEPPPLTVQAIADVAAWLQGLPVAAGNGRGPGTALERGKTLYERDCASCHGAGGEGEAATFRPMVAAQHYAYLLRELNLIRSGERGNSDPAMVKAIRPYADQDLLAVADYMSRLPAPKR